jgi:hypothetical protein
MRYIFIVLWSIGSFIAAIVTSASITGLYVRFFTIPGERVSEQTSMLVAKIGVSAICLGGVLGLILGILGRLPGTQAKG